MADGASERSWLAAKLERQRGAAVLGYKRFRRLNPWMEVPGFKKIYLAENARAKLHGDATVTVSRELLTRQIAAPPNEPAQSA